MAFALALTGCSSPVASSGGEGTGGGSTSEPDGTTTTSSTDAGTSTPGTSTTTSTTGTDASSTGAPALTGPGCGEPPPCTGASVEGHVRIESAADLAIIEGVTAIAGTLEIVGTELECLDAFACLESVGQTVHIQGNAALRSTEGLSSLSAVGDEDAMGPAIFVGDNPALETLDGFGLERLDGSLIVWRNEVLHTIAGFAALRRLERLSVVDNPNLTSLQGLVDLRRLERCNVNNNPQLCISEVFAVCGDVELSEYSPGETQHNDDSC